MGKTHICWIRRVIRLQDNLAFTEAIKGADHLIPLLILEPELMDNAAPFRRALLHNALVDLYCQLHALSSRLMIRAGPAIRALKQLSYEVNGVKFFASHDYSPSSRQRDQEIQQVLGLCSTSGITLREPESVLKDDGTPYPIYNTL